MNRAAASVVAIVASLVCALFAPARASEVKDDSVGYVLSLPDGWERVPDDALQRTRAAMGGSGPNAPNFIAAYEPSSHDTYFQYPYVMVQLFNYGNSMSLATISRAELDDIVSKMTGMPASQLKSGMSEEAAKLLTDASVDSPRVLTSPPGFVMGTTIKAAGIGTVKGRSVALLGRTNAVFVHFYAKESEWSKYAGLQEQIATSFQRTPGQQVTIGAVTRDTSGQRVGGGFDWGKVGGKALAGALIGAVVGGVLWVVKRLKGGTA